MTKFTGDKFKYFYDGVPCTKETVEQLIDYSTTVTVDNFSVFYVSPKKPKQPNPNVVTYYKQREKQSFEDTQNYLLNDTSEEKDYEDIVSLFCAENEDELNQIFARIKLKNAAKKELQKNYDKSTSIFEQIQDTPTNSIKELLKEVDEHQKQNGGRETGNEFPFDAVLTPPKNWLQYSYDNATEPVGDTEYGHKLYSKYEKEKKVIEDWNKFIVGEVEEQAPRNLESIGITLNRESLNLDDEDNKKYFDAFNKIGIKETENKVDYSEINFKLLDLMAKRFNDNKHKYPKGNTLKVINKDEILWAAFRPIRKMIQPIENDPETYEDHLAAVATNMSIILDQLYRK